MMRQIQQHQRRTVMMLVLAGVLGWGRMILAQDSLLPVCTEANLSGPYAYARQGTVVGQGQTAANGVVIFDGQGNLAGSDTASVHGKIAARDFKGEYQVSPDCTGSATFFFSDRELVHLELQLLASRQEVQFIQTDAGTVITGVAKAQRARGYSIDAADTDSMATERALAIVRRPVRLLPFDTGGIFTPGEELPLDLVVYIPADILVSCQNPQTQLYSTDCLQRFCNAQRLGGVGADSKGLYCEASTK